MLTLRTVTVPICLLMAACAARGATVTMVLTSPHNGLTIAAGTPVEWSISASVDAAGNLGLALIAVDFIQDAANPEFLDMPPADPSSIDASMDDFGRPLGISNPTTPDGSAGYLGTPVGPAGQKQLRQIGGAQNVFGVAGPVDIGQDITVETGVGQGPEAQLIAAGVLNAPSRPGAYLFRIENAFANVLDDVSPPPSGAPWLVLPAPVVFNGAGFSITVEQSLGDMNCDGFVDTDDAAAFALALVDPLAYAAQYPNPPCSPDAGDLNQDGLLDGSDVQEFTDLLLGP